MITFTVQTTLSTMLRKLFFLSLLSVGTLVSAQNHHEVDWSETDMMKQKATDRMEVVNETVNLTEEQQTAVYETYMWVELQNEAMKQRYKDAPEDYQADVKHMYPAWDNEVDKRFLKILTKEQMSTWVESLK
jgi:hypothetical protein